MKDTSPGDSVDRHYLEEMPRLLQPGPTDRWLRGLFSNMPSQPEASHSLLLDDFMASKYVSSYDNAQVATNTSSLSFPSQYLYPPTWFDRTEIVDGEYRLTGHDIFHPPLPLGGVHLSGYTNHPWFSSYGHPINMSHAATTPSFVFGAPAPFPAEATWGYQLTPCTAPIPSQAVYRPMDVQMAGPWPLTMLPSCDPSGSSLTCHETPPHASSVHSDPSLVFGMAPPAGGTAVMIRRREGSYMKPAACEETQLGVCLWEDCGEDIACDRSSVNQHMRWHIQDLCARGLLFSSSDGRPFKGQPKLKSLDKCQTYCRWRGDIPCRHSDKYEGKRDEAKLRERRRKVQKMSGRGAKRSDWGRNVHVRQPDTTSGESSGWEVDIKSGRSGARSNGSLIGVQSLVKHICGTHLFSLMMTCEDCDERFSRTDAYGRHRREVHEGESRGRIR